MAWQSNPWNGYGGFGQGPGPYQAPPMRQGQQSMEWIRVPNPGDFEQVAVQPGQTAWIMAQNDSVFGVRAADTMGMVRTRYFRFEEFDPSAAAQQRQASIEERLSRLEDFTYGDQSTVGRFQARPEPAEPQPAGNAVGV